MCLGHADAAERRVDIEGITRHACGDLATLAIKQVRGDDLEIIVGGVSEGALSVTVAERPDSFDIGGQIVAYCDITPVVQLDAGLVQAEIVRIGAPAGRQQYVRACYFRGPFGASHSDRGALRMRREPDAFGAGADMNAFPLEDIANFLGNIRIFAPDQPVAFLDDGHVGAHTAIDLREFEADIAAADDNEMARKLIQPDDRAIGQVGNRVYAREIRYGGPATDIQENPRRG